MSRSQRGQRYPRNDFGAGWKGQGQAVASMLHYVSTMHHNGAVQVVPLGELGRTPQRRVASEARLKVTCWCERKVQEVYESQVALGRTASCGACSAPPGYEEAQRRCCDCGAWYTPRTEHDRRCVPCNVVKHVG